MIASVQLTDGEIWNRAIEWREKIKDWNNKHPDALWHERDQFCRDNGMPSWFGTGHLMWLNAHWGRQPALGWWYVSLGGGDGALVGCRVCGVVERKPDVRTDYGCCSNCRKAELAERQAGYQEKRRQRRKQRSEELANRKGCCLVCGAEMTVARGSKKTCSDRCRKRLLRNPEKYELPIVPDRTTWNGEEMALTVAHKHATRAFYGAAFNPEISYETKKKLEGFVDSLQEAIALLELRESAPAVFLHQRQAKEAEA